MSGYLFPENHERNPLRNERGNTTRTLLLALLLLVAVAGYLYYFTDLIKPHKEAAKPPQAPTARVKQPIPPRPAQPGENGAVPANPADAKPSQGSPPPAPAPAQAKVQAEQKPAQVAVPPVKPAPAAVPPVKPAPAAVPPVKPAPAAVPPVKPVPAAVPPVKPAPAKQATAPAPAKPAPQPAAALPRQTPQSTQPAPPALAAKKEPVPATTVQKAEKQVTTKHAGPYRLLIGDFVPDKTFGAVQAKLKKSGIAPVRKSTVNAEEPMNRLFVAEFGDQDSAEAELQKLRKLTADAFLIPDNGKYILFAGSYFSSTRAASERKKLIARGVNPVVRQARVAIKVTRVTAGSYASTEEARSDAARLKKQGITATVVKAK